MTARWSDHHADARPAGDPGVLILAVVLVVLGCTWVALRGDEPPAEPTLPLAVYVVDRPANAAATAERVP